MVWGEVVYGVGWLEGQALTADWPNFGYKRARVSTKDEDLLAMILHVFERFDKGLLIHASSRRVLEHLKDFHHGLEVVRSSPENPK